MKILNIMAMAVFVLICPAYAQEQAAAPSLEIGFEQTIQRALETSEELKIKEREVVKTQGVYQQARSNMLPNVSATSSWTHYKEYAAGPDKADYLMAGGISASQVLWSFGKVMFAVDSAAMAVEASSLNREAGKQDVIYAAKLSYYSCLFARNALAITEKSYFNALENKELMTQRSYGGRSPKYDIIKMDADIASRVPTVNEARAAYDTAAETLKKLIAADPESMLTLQGEFSETYRDFDYKQLAELMKVNEPSLKSLRKLGDSANEQLKSRHAGYLPTLSAFGYWGRSGGSNTHRFLDENETSRSVYGGLEMSIPLWEGGLQDAQVKQAKADRDIAALRIKQADKQYLLELKKAYLEYQQYKANLTANSEAVKLAGEAFKQAQEMFASGQIDVTDLNDVELLWTSQQLNKEATLFSINTTLAKIEKLVANEKF